MKIPALLVLLALLTSPALAGNWFGSGPWANGAYYPGQYDGVYSATAFSTNGGSIVSGVIGFGLQNGSPTTLTNTTETTSIAVNPAQNYYVLFANGQTFAGTTVANINNNTKFVTGSLLTTTSKGRSTIVDIVTSSGGDFPVALTNKGIFVEPGATGSGGFRASVNSFKGVFTFSGEGAYRSLPADANLAATDDYFSLSGIKVSNLTQQ